jgi:hypothetical protein
MRRLQSTTAQRFDATLVGSSANYGCERNAAYLPLHHRAERDAVQAAGAAVSLRLSFVRSNGPLGRRCINLMPEIVTAAFLNAFEAEYCIDPGLDIAMILLDQVVQVLRRSQRRVLKQQPVSLHFSHRSVRCCVTVQRDGLRSPSLTFDRLLQNGLGRGDIAFGARPEIDSFSCPVNCRLEIDPFESEPFISPRSVFLYVADLFPATSLRLKPIQLPKQVLDLGRLQCGQGEFVLYAL